jgi:aquaporin Z
MPYQKYLAEFIGAFFLTTAVSLSLIFTIPVPTPVVAGLVLCLFVYTVGGISGAHLNPAITIGMWSVRKIKTTDAVMYVFSQLLGGICSMAVVYLLAREPIEIVWSGDLLSAVGEAIGAFFLAFAVLSATLQKVPAAAAGITVGGSLFIGICLALPFSLGVLNPAVAVGLGVLNPMYLFGPIIGAIAGAWVRFALENAHSVTE